MPTFFTSDTHFGDHRTLNLYKRPFASTAEMDAELVRRWNAVVGPGDEVWHLGDFARTAALAREILQQLNGIKHLIVGNNDPGPGVDRQAMQSPALTDERAAALDIDPPHRSAVSQADRTTAQNDRRAGLASLFDTDSRATRDESFRHFRGIADAGLVADQHTADQGAAVHRAVSLADQRTLDSAAIEVEVAT